MSSDGPTHLTLTAPGEPAAETEIVVGEGALADSAPFLAHHASGRTVFLLSTTRLRELHPRLLAGLAEPGVRSVGLSVPDGEAAKSLEHAGRLWGEMLAAGGKRDSLMVAVGGGSVGDLGGFVAGAFLRGIEVVQVPTTLLAQVDAAIGGKTAVDLPGAKNSVGLFHHPRWVIADTAFLATLPRRELVSGLVEVVKMALLLDPDLLGRVERELPRLLAAEPAALAPVVAAAAAAKVGVVERDPKEAGERRLLNFGHTLGHAIETTLGYEGLLHGEAVAYGILFALRLAVARSFEREVAGRMRRLLARFELPELPELDPAELVTAMRRDKKARESGLPWVLPAALGRGRVTDDVGFEEVEAELGPFLADPWAEP